MIRIKMTNITKKCLLKELLNEIDPSIFKNEIL